MTIFISGTFTSTGTSTLTSRVMYSLTFWITVLGSGSATVPVFSCQIAGLMLMPDGEPMEPRPGLVGRRFMLWDVYVRELVNENAKVFNFSCGRRRGYHSGEYG